MQRHGRPAGSCTYSKSCFTVQHGTCITLDAINEIIRQRMNAPLLEVLLGSGLPLPEVPRGSAQNPVAMWDGEFGNPQQERKGRLRNRKSGKGVEGGGDSRRVGGLGGGLHLQMQSGPD